LDTAEDYLHHVTGSTSAQATGNSGIPATADIPGQSTGSLETQEAGSLEIQAAEEFEVAIIASSVECTISRDELGRGRSDRKLRARRLWNDCHDWCCWG